MEDLNKNQIILLALLVSFVSSVATSIMTYSLLSEAPPTVTQTINRVVERTVETVVPQKVDPEVVTKEVTVVVREEDLVIDAISKNKTSLARIWRLPNNSSEEEQRSLVGIGFIVNKEGLIATRKTGDFPENSKFEAVLPGGKVVAISPSNSSEGILLYKIEDLTDLVLTPTSFGDSNSLQLGQSIISIRGTEKDQVSTGRITSLTDLADSEVSKFSNIESDLSGLLVGSPAINLKGEIVGIGVDENGNFLPINLLKADLDSLTQS